MEVGLDTVLFSILKNYLHVMIVVHNKTDDTTTQCSSPLLTELPILGSIMIIEASFGFYLKDAPLPVLDCSNN